MRLSVCHECGRPIEQHGFRGRPKVHCSPKCYKISKSRSAESRRKNAM
jgi:RNA polymerase-binding transcription factor DksA